MREHSDAIKKVAAKLSAMPHDKFMAELEKHKDGDIYHIMQDSLRDHELEHLQSQLTSALKALEAIRDAPGGGPGRRIASQSIDDIKKG